MENIQKKFNLALKNFVDKHKNNPNVIGIIVSGSYIHSKPDKNSDLDVYVLLNKSKIRERGNTWINDVEIEYFINPVDQVRDYFRTETKEKAPSTAHMFANCIVLHKKGKVLDTLIREAKRIIKKKAPKISKFEKEFMRYDIDDLQKDLEDTYLKKDRFTFNLVADQLIVKCLNSFYKVKRTHKEKPKRLKQDIKKLDPKFERFFSKAVLKKDFKSINSLVDYTEKLIGGKRPKEWKIKSKTTTSS